MAGEEHLKELNVRLERLERKLDTVAQPGASAELTEADITAYHKVLNAFWEDGTCGINETSPCVLRCNVWKGGKVVPIPRPKRCINECTCGPGGIDIGALERLRFGGLGL
jgi:hypothetical protein